MRKTASSRDKTYKEIFEEKWDNQTTIEPDKMTICRISIDGILHIRYDYCEKGERKKRMEEPFAVSNIEVFTSSFV